MRRLNYSKIKKCSLARISNVYFNISIQELIVCLMAFLSNSFLSMMFGDIVALFIGGGIAVLAFFVTYYFFFVSKEKMKLTTT